MNDRLLCFMKKFILFSVGFCLYQIVEIVFRGYTFFEMGLLGGILSLTIDSINDKISWHIDLLLQGIIGSFIVTLSELIIGELCNLFNYKIMWDYSDLPFNFDGVICLYFSIAWIFVSIFWIIIADVINYYVLNIGEKPHYHVWKYIIEFKTK